MKVKICGITNLEDAQAAIEAGADLLGFNFYAKSPRYVEPEAARAIVSEIRSNDRCPVLVGVFVNALVAEIQVTLSTVRLDLAQLHGDEPATLIKQLHGQGFKALRLTSPEEAEVTSDRFAGYGPNAPALLVDAYRKDQYGGTGHTVDWSIATRLAQAYPILLAGGLTPDNVGEAIEQVRPWGVDVASGVEASPRKKDVEKMQAFVVRAKGVNEYASNPRMSDEYAANSRMSNE